MSVRKKKSNRGIKELRAGKSKHKPIILLPCEKKYAKFPATLMSYPLHIENMRKEKPLKKKFKGIKTYCNTLLT